MYPLARLLPALYAALSGLAVADVAVPVYEHSVPAETRFYVLLSDSAILAAGGRLGCQSWRCEVVVDVVTRFSTEALSSAPASEISEQVLLRLAGVALALPDGWQCMPGQVHQAGPTPAALLVDLLPVVARRLRLQWEVYLHQAPAQLVAPAAAPRPAGLLTALRGYFQGIF